LFFPLLQQVYEELLDVFWLLIAEDGGQVLEKFEDFVLSEVFIGFTEKLVVTVGDLESVAHFLNICFYLFIQKN